MALRYGPGGYFGLAMGSVAFSAFGKASGLVVVVLWMVAFRLISGIDLVRGAMALATAVLDRRSGGTATKAKPKPAKKKRVTGLPKEEDLDIPGEDLEDEDGYEDDAEYEDEEYEYEDDEELEDEDDDDDLDEEDLEEDDEDFEEEEWEELDDDEEDEDDGDEEDWEDEDWEDDEEWEED